MSSKVIIFCALLFCSEFVVSIPFDEDSIRQRAHPSNWQANQNAAEHYHDTDFAQTHNLNSMTKSEHQYQNGQDFNINQGTQNYDGYRSNNNPSLLQSLPSKENPVNFASEPKDHRSDGFLARRDSYPIKTDPAGFSSHQLRQQNWQAQNLFPKSASNANRDAVVGHETPLITIPESYHQHTTGQQMQYRPPANNQHIHYHQVPETAEKVRYNEHSRPNPELRSGPVRYENYNKGHALAPDSNAANLGQIGYKRRNYLPRPGFPNSGNNYNVHRTAPVNNNLHRNNRRYPGNPVKPFRYNNPLPNTYEIPLVPTNTGPGNAGNNRYLENPDISLVPKAPAFMDNYAGPKNPIPVNNYHGDGVVPTDTVVPQNGNLPPNVPAIDRPVPLSGGKPLDGPVTADKESLIDMTSDNNKSPILNQPSDASLPNEKHEYNMFHHYTEASKRGDMQNFFENPQIKDFLSAPNSHFLIIHPNNTIESIDELEYITRQNHNYVLIRRGDWPADDHNIGIPPAQFQPSGSKTVPDDKQPNPIIPDTLSNKNDTSTLSKNLIPDNYLTSTPSKPLIPENNNNDYGSTSRPRGPVDDNTDKPQPELSPLSPHNTNDRLYNPFTSWGQIQPPKSISTPNDEKPIDNHLLTTLAPNGNDYIPTQGSLDSRNINYPYNQTWDNIYTKTPSKLYTKALIPDDEKIQAYLDSIKNDNKTSSPLSPSGSDNKPTQWFPSPDDTHYNYPIDSSKNVKNPSNTTDEQIQEFLDSNKNDNNRPFVTTSSGTDYNPLGSTSTTMLPEDQLIQQFLNSLSNTNDTNPSSSNNDNNPLQDPSPIYNKYNPTQDYYYTTTPPNQSSSPSSDVTISPIETTSKDPIITISPIEMATDNVKNGTSSTGSNVDQKFTTPSTVQKDNFDDLVIEIKEDKNANNTDKGKNYLKPAVATISTNQNGVNTSDTSTTGDTLLESKNNELKITLYIPNDPDGTLFISIEAPDSTGNGDASDDDTLIVKIDKKNYTDTDNVSTAKDSSGATQSSDPNNNQTPDDGFDKNKNHVIDLLNSVVVCNTSNNTDIFNQFKSENSTCNVMYIINMQPQSQQIIEKDKKVVYFTNGTVLEEMTETTWQNKNDTSPMVVKTTKIYQENDKH